MRGKTISRAQVLLQYYAALAELEQESKAADSEVRVAAAGAAQGEAQTEQIRQPIYLRKQVRVAL